jgi:molybdopterin converting factor subunit 1
VRVHVLYFASFRDAARRDTEARELPEGSCVADLWTALQREIPYFRSFSRMPAPAVNREHVDGSKPLTEGDEVTFLPPVAGG